MLGGRPGQFCSRDTCFYLTSVIYVRLDTRCQVKVRTFQQTSAPTASTYSARLVTNSLYSNMLRDHCDTREQAKKNHFFDTSCLIRYGTDPLEQISIKTGLTKDQVVQVTDELLTELHSRRESATAIILALTPRMN